MWNSTNQEGNNSTYYKWEVLAGENASYKGATVCVCVSASVGENVCACACVCVFDNITQKCVDIG